MELSAESGHFRSGLAVSGAFNKDGKAWLWGFGTNGQLGKGSDDDADEEVCLPLQTLDAVSMHSGTHPRRT